MNNKTIIDVSGTKNQDSNNRNYKDAGHIQLTLEDDKKGQVSYTGTHYGQVAYQDNLELLATGRYGSHGVNGVDGRKGDRGHDGRDATAYVCGTNGGKGGSGTPGTSGGNGGDSGAGGSIDVTVNDEDRALLSVITKLENQAGMVGLPGTHGRNGPGGDGGRGGLPFECQTYERDRHGNTRYINYQPGGWSGPQGDTGYTPTPILFSGKKSTNGAVTYKIRNAASNPFSYNDIFHLKLNLQTPYNKIEPGSEVHADYRATNNTASMPSPMEASPIILENNENITNIETGEVNGNIEPNGEALTHKPVQFKLNHPSAKPQKERYTKEIKMRTWIQNPRLNRYYEGALSEDILIAEYPVFLSPHEADLATKIGVPLQIKSILNQHLNENKNLTLGRKIRVEIMNGRNEVIYTHEFKSEDTWDKIDNTPSISLPKNAELFSKLDVYINLYLQPIDEPDSDKLKLIQQQHLTIMLSQDYVPEPRDFLLVINPGTSSDTIRHWKKVLNKVAHGKEIGIWDPSMSKVNIPAVLDYTSNGTMIILDNEYGQTLIHNSSEIITEDHLYHASDKSHTAFVVAGGNKQFATISATQIMRDNWSEELTHIHDHVDTLISTLFSENMEYNNHTVTMPLEKKGIFGATYVKGKDVVTKLKAKLVRTFPNRNYDVAINSILDDYVVIGVHRMPHAENSNIAHVSTKNPNLSPAALDEAADEKSLISALPFIQKLNLLFAHSDNVYHRNLSGAIITDLLQEQALVRRTETYGTWVQILLKSYQHDFTNELQKLQQLVTFLQKNPALISDFAPLVIQIIAAVQYHAEKDSSFWTKIINFFLPHASEQARQSSLFLCETALKVVSSNPFKPATFQAMKEVDFISRLSDYIAENINYKVSFLFSTRLNSNQLKEAEALLEAAHNKQPVTINRDNIANNASLLRFYKEFKQFDYKVMVPIATELR